MQQKESASEPNFNTACQWWSDLTNIWTPVGWKDHLFRFNVFFNGLILAHPDINKRTRIEPWNRQGVQLAFMPALKAEFINHSPGWIDKFLTTDDGLVRQGWNDSAAPVLWSEWPNAGLLLRQEVFAHVPGGEAISSGAEPLFAWIRLSVHDTCPALPLEPKHGFAIKLNGAQISTSMNAGRNVFLRPEDAKYPRELNAEKSAYSADAGFRLLEKDGRVRLGVAPRQNCHVEFLKDQPTPQDCLLYVQMDAQVGTHVDLLLPMIPAERAVFDRELALGYDAALAEANRFWSRKPDTAARVVTPEKPINDVLAHSLKFAEVIAERNPADEQYSLLSGAFTYADLWTTPHSMLSIMLLDTLGYHAAVEKYLEIFRREQGTVVPPGDSFSKHPGYLSSPKSLTSVDWLSDHGAILYTVSEHALLSGDARFTQRWLEAIVKACQFIQAARAIKKHKGVPGIMPPAVATDRMTRFQAIWNDGWCYKGLTAAVKVLQRAGHARAEEFAREARDYRQTFLRALREKVTDMPRWTDSRGKTHPFVPTAISGEAPDESRHAFYLDAGPLFLVYSGLTDADDELMRETLLWFREGPQARFHRANSDCWQVPCLVHEMSSCEPCYSWNIFHSHQLGDREKFLEGMYSVLAGAISRQTFISCETRGGITGNVFAAPLATYLARLAIVDDQLKENELHLLRLAPLAWLRSDAELIFDSIPTEYGPVSVRAKLSKDEQTLTITAEARFRNAPRQILLHLPPLEGLKKAIFNGKALKVTSKPQVVALA